MFKTDYKRTLLKDGEYEMMIMDSKHGITEGGSEYIELSLKVRDDIEQESQNEYLTERIYKSKETGEYSVRRINNICKSAGIPENSEFEDEEDLGRNLLACLVIAVVKIQFDDYRGEDINRIAYYKPTKIPLQNLKEPTPLHEKAKAEVKKEIEETEEELPW